MYKNPHLKDYAATGGLARAKKLTPKQRSESAKKAARIRWAFKGHVCTDLCVCRLCGRIKFKGHNKYSECKVFACVSLPPPKP